MKIDWVELRSQLAPSVSPVNIGLTVVLFLIKWPLGLLMGAYMFWGRAIDLDLRQPSTIVPAASKLVDKAKQFVAKLKGDAAPANDGDTASGTPEAGGRPALADDNFEQWRDTETEKLQQDRAALERERQILEAEKRAFEDSRKQTS